MSPIAASVSHTLQFVGLRRQLVMDRNEICLFDFAALFAWSEFELLSGRRVSRIQTPHERKYLIDRLYWERSLFGYPLVQCKYNFCPLTLNTRTTDRNISPCVLKQLANTAASYNSFT